MFYLYFTAKLLTFHSTKVISLGGRWSDSKGSVINANDTPSFPFVYVIISVSWGTSLSTLTVESHPSFMSIFYFIYWAQKYTVTIHLNENHFVVIITLHRKPLHGAAGVYRLPSSLLSPLGGAGSPSPLFSPFGGAPLLRRGWSFRQNIRWHRIRRNFRWHRIRRNIRWHRIRRNFR